MRVQIACVCTLFIVCALLSWGCPATSRQSLQQSALRALEGSIQELANPSLAVDDDMKPNTTWRSRPPVPARTRTNDIQRARVTPYQAKRVAAAQDWRCGCGCVDPRDPERRGFLLDESFEIDHKVPTRFGGAHNPSNWVALLRSHHQAKSALESQLASKRKR